MKTPKLTTTETRAKNYCVNIRQSGTTHTIHVEWIKSATWGSNPRITDHMGNKCTNVSGCGYDKLSTALAACLRFLGETPEDQSKIHCTGGCGVSATRAELLKQGWNLTCNSTGRNFEVYTLERVGADPVK